MRVEHPRAGDGPGTPPAAVGVNGEAVPVDEDGTFAVPDDAHSWLGRFAAAYDASVDDLVAGERCDVVMSNDEVCGRELPCPYHNDDEGEEE
ncbi:hypothetical protein [Natronoarchaeum rubrum]|uniref:hypothetical protein n=1 Tax=Natronoarchaeum rubrum TaxID=755311 RepID=UPI002111B34C|nr:hypothetical protein [Natronoarchaeum rubrum]